jgi:hypothetical protein
MYSLMINENFYVTNTPTTYCCLLFSVFLHSMMVPKFTSFYCHSLTSPPTTTGAGSLLLLQQLLQLLLLLLTTTLLLLLLYYFYATTTT